MSAALSALDPALAAHLVPARRLEETRGSSTRGLLTSGVAALDVLLGGGWPRGALGEISGRRSSGRTSVLLASIAAAQRRGEAVALVDTGGMLDPRAAERCGVILDRLLWVRAASGEALRAADLVVSAGGFGLLAVDLGDPASRLPAVPGAAWVRLARAAEKQGTALLVSTWRRRLGTFAAAAVMLEGGAPHFDEPAGGPRAAAYPRAVHPGCVLLGLATHAALLRSRTRGSAPPTAATSLVWARVPDG